MDKINSLEGQKILVTGGKGYLGNHLIKELEKEGAETYILDLGAPENDREYQADITDYQQVKEAVHTIQPDFVYHLAANIDRTRSFEHYNRIMEINVNGTLNLLKALQPTEYRNFIFTSSSEVYGNNLSPFREDQIVQPTSPYSLSKVYGEHLIQTYSEIYNKNYTILRVFNFFGEGMSEGFFIPQIINTLKRNENFSMTEGKQLRDFLYVEDVIQALILSAKNEAAYKEVFNVCSGKGIPIRELAEEIERKVQSTAKILFGAIPYRENEIWEMAGDNSKIKEKLNFSVRTTLQQGVDKCVNN